jgi:predicted secreted protein
MEMKKRKSNVMPMNLQYFAASASGVYPCYENQFQISTGESTMKSIADCETFSVSFDNNVEEWTPYETEGWTRRLMTGKGVTISVTGKRNVGDAGNDAVAELAWKNGRSAEKDFQWTFPDGTVVKFASAIINVKNVGTGDSTAVGSLEFDVMSNGKPEVTVA